MTLQIAIKHNQLLNNTYDQIIVFCQEWNIKEFYVFGSILREDFNQDSDVDAMVVFQENASWGLWDFIDMKWDLEKVFGRSVDLMTKQSILDSANWLRQEEILSTSVCIYG